MGYMVTGNHGEEGFHSGNYHKNPWISIVGFYNFMGGPHKTVMYDFNPDFTRLYTKTIRDKMQNFVWFFGFVHLFFVDSKVKR